MSSLPDEVDNPFAPPEQKPEPQPPPAKRQRGRPKTADSVEPDTLEEPLVPKDMSPKTGERIIGRYTHYYSPEELEYINERLKEFMDTLGNDHRSVALVNEVLQCDIEMQRLDSMATAITQKQGEISPNAVKRMQAISTMRKSYRDRYVEGLSNLGALPKDRYKDDPKESYMVGVWRRYQKELDEMRRRGQRVGHPSPGAKKLAREVGLEPKEYESPGVMGDAEREDLLAKNDAVAPAVDEDEL